MSSKLSLSDNKIILRAFNQSDEEDLAKLLNNKKIWDQLRDYLPHPYTLQDAKDYINAQTQQRPLLTFAIEANHLLVGNISLKPQEDIHRHSAEMGYWIGEPFWGNGFATKSIRLITKYGFNELELTRIYATVMEGNEGSMKALMKAGFEKEGVSKKGFIKNGRYLDEHRFALLNSLIFT